MILRTAFLLCLAALAAGRKLSEKCSGYSPEDCSKVPGCKTCWDGRFDCYLADEDVYGYWCESQGAKDVCFGKSEAACEQESSCVYCKSAAVGNQCYTEEDAKKLPAAIFSCSWPSAY